MKHLLEFIFENLIFEYERNININDTDIEIQIGNHADFRKQRGICSNFKINQTYITDDKIISVIKRFKNAILNKISNNTLIVGDFNKSIQIIDYNITIALSLKALNAEKYVLVIKSVWPTDDDYGNYKSKYNKNKINKDNTKIFISDLKQ